MADIVINSLRGGRNGVDSPLELPLHQCVEALNVHLYGSPLGTKRYGASSVAVSGGTAFTGSLRFLGRYVPTDDASAQLWAIDSSNLLKRRVAGTWSDVTMDDAITGNGQSVSALTFNGKYFLAYQSAVPRLHVYDPLVSAVRRVGLAPPTAPTTADQGSGSYPATLRYYRTRAIQLNGSVIVRRSEPSPSVAFTPSGSGASVRITHGTLPSERETHWEIEVSFDDEVYYLLYAQGTDTAGSPIAAATGLKDDSTDTSSFYNFDTSEEVGSFVLPPEARFLSTDLNRLLMCHRFGTGPTCRIDYTPALGSSDHGDDERLIQTDALKTYIDVNEHDGGETNGLSLPVSGTIYVPKYREMWSLIPSNDPTVPYFPRKVSNTVGIIDSRSIVMAEDAAGNPSFYFLSAQGPYRVGSNGLEYLGRDIEDYWFGLNGRSSVNLSVTQSPGVYHSDIHEVWWWLTVGSDSTPTIKIALDVKQAINKDQFGVRGGWMIHTGESAKVTAAAMYVDTTSGRMKPFICPATPSGGIPQLGLADDRTVKTDFSVAFQSYILSRAYPPSGSITQLAEMQGEPLLVAGAQSGVTVQLTVVKDFGLSSPVSSVLLTPDGSETRVIRKFEGAAMADAKVLQFQLGDVSAVSSAWAFDLFHVPIQPEGDA